MNCAAIETWLVSKIAGVLEVDAAKLDRTQPFTSYGLDSLALLMLTAELAETLGRDLSTTLVWEFPSIKVLADHLASNDLEPEGEAVPHFSRDQLLPLTFSQERIWRYARRDGEGDANLLVDWFCLTGPLNVEALRLSVGAVIQRHEILRTTFHAIDGQPHQVVHPSSGDPLEVTDFSLQLRPEEAAARLVAAVASQSMHLERGPLLRALLLRLAETEHWLVLVLHHLLYDVKSLVLLYTEIGTSYAGFCASRPPPSDEAALQMADFAAWQRKRLRRDGQVYQRAMAWWKQYWAGPMPPPLTLPLRRRGDPPMANEEEGTIYWDVPDHIFAGIRDLARSTGATANMIFLAVFQGLVYEITGLQEWALGSYVSDRIPLAARNAIGFFVNLIALRVHLDLEPTFLDILNLVRADLREASVHQELPFEEFVRELEREGRLVPPVQVIFQHVVSPEPMLHLPGLSIRRRSEELPQRKFWGLSWTMLERPTELRIRVELDTTLYDPSTVIGMLRRYEILLGKVSADSGFPFHNQAER